MNWKNHTNIKVRFADVDMMRHLNNAKYVTYLEESRVSYFQQFPELDFMIGDPDTRDSVIVASLRLDYRSPAYLNETMIVAVQTKEIRRSSFTMEYEIKEEKSGRLVATAETIMVYFDYRAQKSLEIPEGLRKRFGEIEGREFPKP